MLLHLKTKPWVADIKKNGFHSYFLYLKSKVRSRLELLQLSSNIGIPVLHYIAHKIVAMKAGNTTGLSRELPCNYFVIISLPAYCRGRLILRHDFLSYKLCVVEG